MGIFCSTVRTRRHCHQWQPGSAGFAACTKPHFPCLEKPIGCDCSEIITRVMRRHFISADTKHVVLAFPAQNPNRLLMVRMCRGERQMRWWREALITVMISACSSSAPTILDLWNQYSKMEGRQHVKKDKKRGFTLFLLFLLANPPGKEIYATCHLTVLALVDTIGKQSYFLHFSQYSNFSFLPTNPGLRQSHGQSTRGNLEEHVCILQGVKGKSL